MNWIISAILSSLFFSLSNAVTKVFQPRLSYGLGLGIFSLGVLLTSLVILLFSKTPIVAGKLIQQSSGLALVSGFIWGIAQFFFLLMLSKNAPLSVAIPIVVGGIGIGGILAGILFFGEQMTLMRIIGATIVLVGSVILAKS